MCVLMRMPHHTMMLQVALIILRLREIMLLQLSPMIHVEAMIQLIMHARMVGGVGVVVAICRRYWVMMHVVVVRVMMRPGVDVVVLLVPVELVAVTLIPVPVVVVIVSVGVMRIVVL